MVRCRACFRTESEGQLISAGGARRVGDPERRAFATLEASARGELGPVVGRCAACGQPLVSDAPSPAVEWTIAAPNGGLRWSPDGTLTIDGAPTDWERARQWVNRQFPPAPEGPRVRLGVVQAVLLVLMVAPVAVWLFSVVFVTVFLYRFPESPP